MSIVIGIILSIVGSRFSVGIEWILLYWAVLLAGVLSHE